MYNKKLKALTKYFLQSLESFTKIKYHCLHLFYSGSSFLAKICEYSKYPENSVITTRYRVLQFLYPTTPKTGIG